MSSGVLGTTSDPAPSIDIVFSASYNAAAAASPIGVGPSGVVPAASGTRSGGPAASERAPASAGGAPASGAPVTAMDTNNPPSQKLSLPVVTTTSGIMESKRSCTRLSD